MSVNQERIAAAIRLKRPHDKVMGELKSRLERIRDILPASTPIVYIDYPLHGNIGDLLIHAGADAFLEDHGYDLVGRYSLHDLISAKKDILRERLQHIDGCVAKGAALVLHGGGNVGDIWPRHQALREALVSRYPDAPIVVFPQSVHFNDPAARARSAAAMRRHRNIRFFVRDEELLEFAGRECDCPAEVLPDMAHHLWKRGRLSAPKIPAKGGTLVQRRRDKERTGEVAPKAFDWDDLRRVPDRVSLKVLARWSRLDHPFEDAMPTWRFWNKVRDRLIRRAVDRFSLYEAIDTDRLHGVILGALLEKQIVFRDNCYGKLSRYCSLWLSDSDRIDPGGVMHRPADSRTGRGQIVSILSQRSKHLSDPSEGPLR